MQNKYNTYYSSTAHMDTDILYSYNENEQINEIDYSFTDNLADANHSLNGDLNSFNLDINTDDLIIIGIVIFLFAENSVDFTTLAALGLLLFSNNF